MAELIDPRTGAAYDVPDDQVSHAQAQWGLVTPEQQALTDRYGSVGEQAKAAGKLAANVATFGIVGDSPEDRQAISVFKDQSPTLAMMTEMAGAVAPGAAGGAVAGAALRGLGLGQRAAQLGAVVAEDVTASTAIEREQAAIEGNDMSFANIVSGVPLAAGVSAAARLARTGQTFSAYSAGKRAGQAMRGLTPDVEDLAARPNAISQGAKTSRARRSVGAAGSDADRAPLPERDVRLYAENADEITAEVNKAMGDAIDEILPDFDEVHSVGLNKQDFAGRMQDADRTAMLDLADEQMNTFTAAQERFSEAGQKQQARMLGHHVQKIADAAALVDESPEVMAEALNNAKRELYRARGKYGGLQDAISRDLAEYLDELHPSLRKGLEDQKTFGKAWGEAQQVENLKWAGDKATGKRGLIDNMSMWQRELLQETGIKDWVGHKTVRGVTSRGDLTERLLGMNDKDYSRIAKALREYIEDATDKTLYRVESGRPSAATTPVMRLQKNLDALSEGLDEIENLREAMNKRGGKEIAAKAKSKRAAVGPLEQAFDIAEELPVIGGPLKKARSMGLVDFEVPVLPPKTELTREMAQEAIRARLNKNKPGYNPPPRGDGPDGGAIPKPGPRPVESPPAAAPAAPQVRTGTRGSASVGAMAGAGALGAAALAAPPVMQLLKDMNDDNAAVRERAALGLVAPATRPQPLPSTIARFKEGNQSLVDSFAMRKDDLINALSNPEALLAGLDDAFGDLGETHPNLYGDILARSHAAAQYVMASAPPSVAIGLTRPDGISPDPLALAKFADIWSGAFNPGDVIYDVGTGNATPTQVKALKDVHPDVYDALRLDILKAVGEAEGRVPFETLRKLDVLFDVPGIAPPSFQPAMSKTMQAAWAEPAGGNRGKPSDIAGPGDPNAKFGAGPSTLQ